MQPREDFESSPATRIGHTCFGTLWGTVGGFFARSVQKTEGERGKATVFLTVADRLRRSAILITASPQRDANEINSRARWRASAARASADGTTERRQSTLRPPATPANRRSEEALHQQGHPQTSRGWTALGA